MPQFDVHRNPGRTRAAVPFLVTLQSRLFDDAPTQLVAPLLARMLTTASRPPVHLPGFTIDGRAVILDALQIQPIPRSILGPAIASLADDASATLIIDALDAVFSRAHG